MSSSASNSRLEGTVVKGTVVDIDNDEVVVDVGLKSEGRVPLKEFGTHGQPPEVRVGDRVDVYVERFENRSGEAVLSRDKARREESWNRLERGFNDQSKVEGSHLRPGQGRLRRRPRRCRGLPAGLAGRHPAGARHRPADQQARAVPDPEDGPPARQHRGLAPGRARGEPGGAAQRAALHPPGRPDPGRRGQEHHRLRCLRRPWRPRRPAPRHRHLLEARQPPERRPACGPDRPRAGDPLQPRDPAHLPGHEAARGRSLGGRRAQVPGGGEVHRPRHQHHRLRRLRGAGAGCGGPGPRLRDVVDEEERPSGQDRVDLPGGRGHGPGGRSREAAHQPGPEADHPEPLGGVRRAACAGLRGRRRDQEHHRVRSVRRSRQRHRRHGPPLRHRVGGAGRGGRQALQQGRHRPGSGARRRRREGAHLAGHQAAR